MELSSLTSNEMAGDHNRWRIGDDLTDEQRLRVQTEALVRDVIVEDLGEMEYVD
jgi:hypothetical protein